MNRKNSTMRKSSFDDIRHSFGTHFRCSSPKRKLKQSCLILGIWGLGLMILMGAPSEKEPPKEPQKKEISKEIPFIKNEALLSTDPRFTISTLARQPMVTVPLGGDLVDGDPISKDRSVSRIANLIRLGPREGEGGLPNRSLGEGWAAPENTSITLAYTTNALYVGFTIQLSGGILSPQMSATEGRDQGIEKDDSFKIFLVDGDRDGEQFLIGGNAAGMTWKQRLDQPDKWSNWNPKITYMIKQSSAFESDLWQGEFLIPWSELGVAPPKEGEVWRANFVVHRRRPEDCLDAWVYTKDQANYSKSTGRLVFGGERLYLTTGSWQGAFVKKGGMRFDVKTPAYIRNSKTMRAEYKFPDEARRKVEWSYALCHRNAGEDKMAPFYHELEGQSLEKTIKLYPNVDGWLGGNHFAVPPLDFKQAVVSCIQVNKGGDYVLAYYLRDITSTEKPLVIAGGVVPFRIRTEVQAKILPYLLTRKSVVLHGDLRALGEKKADILQLKGWIAKSGEKKVLAETTVKYQGGEEQDVEVSVNGLAVGKYETYLAVLDQANKVVSQTKPMLWNRPEEPDWWVNRDKYGMTPEVPEPWTPIEWKAGVANVWGREMRFENSPLPRELMNQGEAILAQPIELELKVDGKVQEWKNRSIKVLEQKPGHILFETTQEASGVQIKSRVQCEFDGFALVDLDLKPLRDKIQIDGLDLVIPLKAQYAEFLSNYKQAPGPGPAKFNRYLGKTLDHYESPVMITTWLGADEFGGLEWSCESSKGWSLAQPNKAIEVNRKGEVVEARFHFVDHPIELEQKSGRQIRFGLIATPTKPVPAQRMNWWVDASGGGLPSIPGKKRKDGTVVTEEDLKQYREKGGSGVDICADSGAGYGVWPSSSGYKYKGWTPPVMDSELVKGHRDISQLCQEFGIRRLLYGGWSVSSNWELWDPYGKEMIMWVSVLICL